MADLLTSIRAEIDVRLRELAPAIAEYERLSTAADALSAEGAAASRPAERAAPKPAGGPAPASAKKAAPRKAPRKGARRARKRERPAHSPTGQAILAALEHGSHTLAELVMVTALRASDIRDSLRHLRKHKAIVKTDRDGKAAYALSSDAAK
jgi:hypothetical protein